MRNLESLITIHNQIIRAEVSDLATIQSEFEAYALLEQEIKEEMSDTMTLPELRLASRSNYRNENKEYYVDAYFDKLLNVFTIGTSKIFEVTNMSSSNVEIIREKLLKQTQESIDRANETRKQLQREREAADIKRGATMKKSLSNPETIAEYEFFLRIKSRSDLSTEQREQYDALVAEKTITQERADKKKASVLAQVQLDGTDMTIIKGYHSKKNFDLWIVKLSDRVDGPVFNDLRAKAKRLGGWYSRYSRDGAIPGFQFKTEESANTFAGLKNGDVDNSKSIDDQYDDKLQRNAAKLIAMADRWEEKGQEVLTRDRLTNTSRRARMAANTEADAEHKIYFAKVLRKIAEAIENGESTTLENISSAIQLSNLLSIWNTAYSDRMRKENHPYGQKPPKDITKDAEFIKMPYPSFHKDNMQSWVNELENKKGAMLIAKRIEKQLRRIPQSEHLFDARKVPITDLEKMAYKLSRSWDKDKILDQTLRFKRLQKMGLKNLPTLRSAVRELAKFSERTSALTPEQEQAKKIKALERKFVGRKIPGFFPTPTDLIKQMLEMVNIEEGDTIFEPSAGLGHIADEIKEQYPDNELEVGEYNSSLSEALTEKGHKVVCDDFLACDSTKYDVIIMNPPFEKDQDIEHVLHAYEILNPGGRIVAIMANNKNSTRGELKQKFQDFLTETNAYVVDNPSNSFRSAFRPTGVNTITVSIEKEADAAEVDAVEALQEELDVLSVTEMPSNEDGASSDGAQPSDEFDQVEENIEEKSSDGLQPSDDTVAEDSRTEFTKEEQEDYERFLIDKEIYEKLLPTLVDRFVRLGWQKTKGNVTRAIRESPIKRNHILKGDNYFWFRDGEKENGYAVTMEGNAWDGSDLLDALASRHHKLQQTNKASLLKDYAKQDLKRWYFTYTFAYNLRPTIEDLANIHFQDVLDKESIKSLPIKNYKTGAMKPTLSVKAEKNGLWFSQTQAFNIQAAVKMQFADTKPSKFETDRYNEFMAARADRWKYTNYKMGSWGGVWVFEKDGRLLTKEGAKTLSDMAMVPTFLEKDKASSDGDQPSDEFDIDAIATEESTEPMESVIQDFPPLHEITEDIFMKQVYDEGRDAPVMFLNKPYSVQKRFAANDNWRRNAGVIEDLKNHYRSVVAGKILDGVEVSKEVLDQYDFKYLLQERETEIEVLKIETDLFPAPKRGGKYNKAEWSNIIQILASTAKYYENPSKVMQGIADTLKPYDAYWRNVVSKGSRDDYFTRKMFGVPNSVALNFLVPRSGPLDIVKKFEDKNNRTLDKVNEHFQQAVKVIIKRMNDLLSVLNDREIWETNDFETFVKKAQLYYRKSDVTSENFRFLMEKKFLRPMNLPRSFLKEDMRKELYDKTAYWGNALKSSELADYLLIGKITIDEFFEIVGEDKRNAREPVELSNDNRPITPEEPTDDFRPSNEITTNTPLWQLTEAEAFKAILNGYDMDWMNRRGERVSIQETISEDAKHNEKIDLDNKNAYTLGLKNVYEQDVSAAILAGEEVPDKVLNQYRFRDLEYFRDDRVKEIEYTKIDVDLFPAPKRGGVYNISEWAEIRNIIDRVSNGRSNNSEFPNKSKIMLLAYEALRPYNAYMSHVFYYYLYNYSKPKQWEVSSSVFGYQSFNDDAFFGYQDNVKFEMHFADRSSRTLDNVKAYYVERFQIATKKINQFLAFMNDDALWKSKDAQEFVDRWRPYKKQYLIESNLIRNFIRNKYLRPSLDLPNWMNRDRGDEKILKELNFGKGANPHFDNVIDGLMDGTINLSELKEIVDMENGVLDKSEFSRNKIRNTISTDPVIDAVISEESTDDFESSDDNPDPTFVPRPEGATKKVPADDPVISEESTDDFESSDDSVKEKASVSDIIAKDDATITDFTEKIEKRLRDAEKNKEFKDSEFRKPGARKEQRAYELIVYQNLSDLEDDPVFAYKTVNKDKVWPKLDIDQERVNGVSAGAAYWKQQLRKAMSKRPFNSADARKVYVKGISLLNTALSEAKTLEETIKAAQVLIRPKIAKSYIGDDESLKSPSGIYISYKITSKLKGIFGVKFLNLVNVRSAAAKKHYTDASIYDAFTQEQQAVVVAKKIAIENKNIAFYQKRLAEFPEGYSAIPGYEKAINRVKTNIAKLENLELEGLLKPWEIARENDWSWADPSNNKRKAPTQKTQFKINSKEPLSHIIRKGGIELPYVTATNIDNVLGKELGFYSIEYGNSLPDKEREKHANYFYAAMTDLEEITGLDIKKINQAGKLGIGFATRGTPGSAATYWSSYTIINLNRRNGDGSLNHEWGHYMDDMLSVLSGKEAKINGKLGRFASRLGAEEQIINRAFKKIMNFVYESENTIKINVPAQSKTRYNIKKESVEATIKYIQRYEKYWTGSRRQKLLYGFAAHLHGLEYIEVEVPIKGSKYLADSVAMGSNYWIMPEELFARMFEAYIWKKMADKGVFNNYLQSDPYKKYFSSDKAPPYPMGEELETIYALFDNLIEKVKEALDATSDRVFSGNRVDIMEALPKEVDTAAKKKKPATELPFGVSSSVAVSSDDSKSSDESVVEIPIVSVESTDDLQSSDDKALKKKLKNASKLIEILSKKAEREKDEKLAKKLVLARKMIKVLAKGLRA